MQIIGLTKAAGFAVLTFTLIATPACSQTNQNSVKETSTLDSQNQSDIDLAESHFNRGNIYALTQKWDLALANYDKAIALNPNDYQAYNNRGSVYNEQEKWDLALADYTQAIKLNPNDADAYINRGDVYHRQK